MIRTYHTYMKVSIFIKGCVFIKEKVFFCIKSQEKKELYLNIEMKKFYIICIPKERGLFSAFF